LNVVIERSKNAYDKTGTAYRRNGIALLIVGLIFLSFGLLPALLMEQYGALFMAPFGFVLLLWSYFSYKSAKQIESTEKNA